MSDPLWSVLFGDGSLRRPRNVGTLWIGSVSQGLAPLGSIRKSIVVLPGHPQGRRINLVRLFVHVSDFQRLLIAQ